MKRHPRFSGHVSLGLKHMQSRTVQPGRVRVTLPKCIASGAVAPTLSDPPGRWLSDLSISAAGQL